MSARDHLSPQQFVDLYHRTDPDAAGNIVAHGFNLTRARQDYGGKSNVYATDRPTPDTPTTGYGESVVHLQVPREHAHLDDEFRGSDGKVTERHYLVDGQHAKVVRAWSDYA